jgi:hypothetical protein
MGFGSPSVRNPDVPSRKKEPTNMAKALPLPGKKRAINDEHITIALR